ncbi:MAG: hypothetical protein HFE72_08170 [Emergencia sp.]|nr:hypothetical protein [Emergencia sp.]
MNYKDFIKGDTLKIAESLVSISDFSKDKLLKFLIMYSIAMRSILY